MAQMLVSTLCTFRPLSYSYTTKVTPIIGYSSRQETKERNVIGLVSRCLSIVIYRWSVTNAYGNVLQPVASNRK